MTLRDTELIGKKLVKYGFNRSGTDHHSYRYLPSKSSISVKFTRFGVIGWSALIVHEIDSHTTVKFDSHEAVFTPEWLVEEHKKLQAMFKFIRG